MVIQWAVAVSCLSNTIGPHALFVIPVTGVCKPVVKKKKYIYYLYGGVKSCLSQKLIDCHNKSNKQL